MSHLTESERDAFATAAGEQELLVEQQRDRQATEEAELSEKATSFFGAREEVVMGTARGITGAIEATAEIIAEIDEWAIRNVGALDLNPFDDINQGIWRTPEEIAEAEALGDNIESPFRMIETGAGAVKDFINEPKTVLGSTSEVVSKVVTGFFGAGKIRWIAKLKEAGKLGNIAGWMAQGALADFFVFDGEEERASDFLIQFDNPAFNNAVTQYLAASTDQEASEIEGRMKNVLEGAGIGLMADGVIGIFRVLRPLQRARELVAKRNAARLEAKKIEAEADSIQDSRITAVEMGFFPEADVIVRREVVESSKSSASSPFKVVVNDSGKIQVQASRGDILGGIELKDTGDSLQAFRFQLEDSTRGFGVGVRAIEEAINYAFSKGKKLTSDSSVEEAAAAIWPELKRRGYKITKHDSTLTDGTWRSDNGGPVFTVDELPPGLKIDRVDATQVLLNKSVDMDAIRGSVQRIIDNGDTAKLINAIDKGDKDVVLELSGNQQHFIDWDSFADDPESLLRFVKAVEETFEEVITAAKGGPVSLAKIVNSGINVIAKQSGSAPSKLFADVIRDEGLAGRVYAGAQLLQEARTEMFRLAELARGGDNAAQAQFKQHMNTYAVLEAQVTGSNSQIARAMRAMQIIKVQRQSPLFDIVEMLREAGQGGDIQKLANDVLAAGEAGLSEVIKKSQKVTMFDEALEMFFGNLLSAPTTQFINILGNIGMGTWDMMARHFAVIPAMTKRAFGGTGSTGIPEVKGAWLGMWRGLAYTMRFLPNQLLGDWNAAGKSLNWQNPFRSALEIKKFVEESDKVGTMYRALLSGEPQTDIVTKLGEAGTGRKAIGYTLPSDIADKPMLASIGHYSRWIVNNTAGSVIRLPGRLILTADEFFKGVARDIDKYSKVYAQAAEMTQLEKGLDPLGAHNFTVSKTADALLELDPDEVLSPAKLLRAQEFNKEGLDFARRQTFQSPLEGGAVMNAMGRFEKLVGATKGLKLFFPFIRTSTNLALKTMELTPVFQMLSARFRGELAAGGMRQNKAMAEIGMSFTAGFFILDKYGKGEVKGTGSGKNSAQLDGSDRYTIKLLGHWIKFDRLDPFGAFIGFTTDMIDLFEQNVLSPEMEAEGSAMLTSFFASFSANFTNKTYLRGLSELIEAMHYAERGNTESMEKLLNSTLFSLMPFIGSNFERRRADGMEEYSKFIFGWLDEFKSRIPASGGIPSLFGIDVGTRHDLGTRRDPLGRKIKIKQQLGPDSRLWNPIDVTVESISVLDRALAQMDFNITMPPRRISGVKLTGLQYSKFLFLRGQEVKIAGLTLTTKLEREVARPLFLVRKPQDRQDRINDLVQAYGRKARKQLLREDKPLKDAIDAADQAKNDALGFAIASATALEGGVKPAEDVPTIFDILTQKTSLFDQQP